jgi:hypothetical protein
MSVMADRAVMGSHACQIDNALTHYYTSLQALMATESEDGSGSFNPGYELPPLDDRLAEFFSVSTVSWHDLPALNDTRLALLDLRRNPASRTTKTFASLMMVARAAAHIRRTGERIMIVTPSSANKVTALRDAVLRAIRTRLVEPEQLQIVSVVPWAARGKLWSSALSADRWLRQRNPVLAVDRPRREEVKAVVSRFAEAQLAPEGVRLWFTLSLGNYRLADAIRAFVEHDLQPVGVRQRVHAHAVSSAFGLLGHAHGRTFKRLDPLPYFLVQHLNTPDMVLDLYRDSFEPSGLPRYQRDEATGLWTQREDQHFPQVADDLGEVLEPTFYTHAPGTSASMKNHIRRLGAGGIVVSLRECLQHYPLARAALAETDIELPADPRELREWSLVMALTGVSQAVQRGLIPGDAEVVIHASGSYTIHDYQPIPEADLIPIGDEHDLAQQVREAAR